MITTRMDYIRFFHLRAYDRINAPQCESAPFSAVRLLTKGLAYMTAVIAQMERASGVTFHEAQIALARQWVGKYLFGKDVPRDVYIKIPQEPKFGVAGAEDTPVKKDKVPLPETLEAAREVLARFESGVQALQSNEIVADSVSHHALQGRRSLMDETWIGTDEEELNWCATPRLVSNGD